MNFTRLITPIILLTVTIILSGCGVEPPKLSAPLPSLQKQFDCLPQETAIISAHRGTARGTDKAENSIAALEMLIKKGYLMAEIDVAKLKDGTHILYHDGIWEDGSTGKGVLAATTWESAKTFLLKDTQGRLTSQTIPKLKDYLLAAKDRIYLEIDFKSSANYQYVINAITDQNMSDHVILIAYSQKQAHTLSKLAPQMMISVSTNRSNDVLTLRNQKVAAWVGGAINDQKLISKLGQHNIPILGKIGYDWSAQKANAAHVLVTDYAFEHRPITGLTAKLKKNYADCISS